MARLIQKPGYIKAGKAGGYMKYIATRERVEKIEGNGHATQKQQRLIADLLRDYPDAKESFEYEDYTASPTVANASSLITMTLDTHANEAQERDGYMKYIALRPRAERHGEHGLFGKTESVSLDAALKELEAHNGNVWTIIYSLRREDAARLGYDHAEGWRRLLLSKQAELATTTKIRQDHLRWYAAFHDEGEHPHIHVMVWSEDPKEGYLSKDGLLKLQSQLTNEIFRGELQELYVRKNVSYKEVTATARKAMSALVRKMESSMSDSPEIEQKMSALAQTLASVGGKKVYGYLKKPVKDQVDGIVDALGELPEVAECYAAWNKLKDELDGYYRERPRKHLPLSQQKEFKAIKNMVIQEAENLRLEAMTFEGEDMAEPDDTPDDMPWVEVDLDAPIDEPNARYTQPTVHGGKAVWRQAQEYRGAKAVLGDDSSSAEEKHDAVEALERLWSEGFTVAAHQLGKVWRDGLCDLPDMEAAEQWFRRSAEVGNDYSQYALGKLLQEQGRLQEAALWFSRAAQKGNQYAQYRLAKLYLTGEGVPQDAERAAELLTGSASQGNQWAQYLLGKLYLQGQGVEQDTEIATDWLMRSSSHGNVYAQYLLDRIAAHRDPSVALSVLRLLHCIAQIFRETPPPANPAGARIESKRRKKLMQKRIALGQRPDDHEDELNNKYQQPSM